MIKTVLVVSETSACYEVCLILISLGGRAKQLIEIFLGDFIAFASALLQSSSVKDRNAPACIIDESVPLERVGRVRHARSPHSEHHGQKLLGELELTRFHAILRHQQPATTPLFHEMKYVTCRRLRYLFEECVSIMEHQFLQIIVTLHFRPEEVRSHSKAGAGHLHIDARGCLLVAKKHWNPNKTLIANCPDFGGIAVHHCVNQRSDAGLNEMYEFNRLVRLIKRKFITQHLGDEMRAKFLKLFVGQRCEQPVLVGAWGRAAIQRASGDNRCAL
jgi:hypothetical protein